MPLLLAAALRKWVSKYGLIETKDTRIYCILCRRVATVDSMCVRPEDLRSQ